jgi:hypothetical protein
MSYSGGDGLAQGVGGTALGRDSQARWGRGAVVRCQSIKWFGRVSRCGGDVCAGASSEADLARGGAQPSSEADLAQGGVQPSSEADHA